MFKALMLVLTGVLAAAVLGVGTASAKGGNGVITTGTCSAGSTWKLKLQPEDGRIEVEFEVDSNVVGQVWRVTMSDNGKQFFNGRARTKAPSGSFEIRKLTADQAGPDKIEANARNKRTGEVCNASGTL